MRSKNVRLVIFVGACLMLLGVVFFRNNVVGDKFAQANALMSRLQSSALYTDTLTDSELTLLKTTREESQDRIALLTTTINNNIVRAKGMIAEISLQTAILDNFTLKAPRSYFTNNVDTKLGILSTNTDLKGLLDSINIQVNDRNIRESFIVWYDEFFATVCSTTDSANDVSVKGTVTFQNGSPASTDTCQGNVLVQTQCINKQNIGTIQTTCPGGCSDGVCTNASASTLKGFTITMVDTISNNTPTSITISAIKNDNSVDVSYHDSVVILVDGDPNATLPLRAQTLVNGTITIDNTLKFKKVGNVSVIVTDPKNGLEARKNVVVTDGTSGTNTTETTTVSTTSVTTESDNTTTDSIGTSGATTNTTLNTTDSTTVSCTDSDGGKDYFIKGQIISQDTLNIPGGSLSDQCSIKTTTDNPNGNYYGTDSCFGENCYLNETYCSSAANQTTDFYHCPNGCKDGACLVNPVGSCSNLTTTSNSVTNGGTITLICSGVDVSIYNIVVEKPDGTVLTNFPGANGAVDIPSSPVGNYVAKCFINGQTTTPIGCQKTISNNTSITALNNNVPPTVTTNNNTATITCPPYTPPDSDFCIGGNIVGGGTNEVGCQVPPTCEPKVTTGPVSINEAGKDCWFGDASKRITLGEFLGYQSNPSANSGILVNSDAIGLFGSSAPSLNSVLTNLLTYEEINGTAQWKGDSTISNSTQLTNFFVFRTTSEGTRTWNIPSNGIKFYGCFTRGDQPTVW